MKHLITGGARSGKSRYAEQCAVASGKKLVYLATGQARDEEMADRIALHKNQRGEQWTLVEEPREIAHQLEKYSSAEYCVLVDCLTLWLNNCLEGNCWLEQKSNLLATLRSSKSDLLLVGNEVGSGIVPLGQMTRQFVDENGWLHQDIASDCSHVTTVIAGLPLALKQPKQ
ncbi:MAG: bifunctional adenosylcobinamide kinase/adenosylcobinamide-phosphate guanylyltransferase [Halioglobus sp.]